MRAGRTLERTRCVRGTCWMASGCPAPVTPPTTTVWVLLTEVIRKSGVYSNVDFGNVAAQDQGELHAALRTCSP